MDKPNWEHEKGYDEMARNREWDEYRDTWIRRLREWEKYLFYEQGLRGTALDIAVVMRMEMLIPIIEKMVDRYRKEGTDNV